MNRDQLIIGGGAAACAVCCAAPVLGLLGIAGVGVAATAATLAFAGVVFALVVAGLSVVAVLVRRRSQRRDTHIGPQQVEIGANLGVSTDSGPTMLGEPVLPPPRRGA